MKLCAIEITEKEYREFYFLLQDRWAEYDGFYTPPPHIGKVENILVYFDGAGNIVGFFSAYRKYYHYRQAHQSRDQLYSSVYILQEYRGKRIIADLYQTALEVLELDWIFAIVDKENISSRKAHDRIGLEYGLHRPYGKRTYLIEKD